MEACEEHRHCVPLSLPLTKLLRRTQCRLPLRQGSRSIYAVTRTTGRTMRYLVLDHCRGVPIALIAILGDGFGFCLSQA